jgi:hypothetical protein
VSKNASKHQSNGSSFKWLSIKDASIKWLEVSVLYLRATRASCSTSLIPATIVRLQKVDPHNPATSKV